MADISKLDYFAPRYLKQSGDLKDKCIQRWHLATDVLASGVYASGIFDYIKIDGPTTSGWVLTTDADGWGTWQPASGSAGSTTFLALTDTPSSYAGFSASGVRVNSGANALEFYAISAGAGTPGGSDTYVQYNDGGVFGGDDNFTWDKIQQQLIVDGSATFTGQVLSTLASGTAPLIITSPTLVTNLNSDMLDSLHADDFWKKSDTVTAGDADTLDGYHGTHYNPMTALGDIIYGGAAGDPQRLPAGAQYTVLHGGTTPSWSQVVELDIALSNNTTNNVSAAKHGFAPILPANSNLFLDGQGNWSTPAGGEVDNYSLTAFSGQTSVNIAHGFGSYPVVQVIDNTGAMLVPQSVTHNSLNDFTVTFNTATSGNIMATIGGPQSYSVKKVSSNYTVLRTDKNVQATASGITITLPWASGVSGFEFRIDNESTGEIYLMSGSGYIQHELSQTIPTDSCLMTYSDGTNWRIT